MKRFSFVRTFAEELTFLLDDVVDETITLKSFEYIFLKIRRRRRNYQLYTLFTKEKKKKKNEQILENKHTKIKKNSKK